MPNHHRLTYYGEPTGADRATFDAVIADLGGVITSVVDDEDSGLVTLYFASDAPDVLARLRERYSPEASNFDCASDDPLPPA
jgi:hypothetical protein